MFISPPIYNITFFNFFTLVNYYHWLCYEALQWVVPKPKVQKNKTILQVSFEIRAFIDSLARNKWSRWIAMIDWNASLLDTLKPYPKSSPLALVLLIQDILCWIAPYDHTWKLSWCKTNPSFFQRWITSMSIRLPHFWV